MPIKVYGLAMSTCTQRVLTTLTEKGLKYELVPVDLFAGEQKVKLKLKFCFSKTMICK
jgi:glutathione S-transferase